MSTHTAMDELPTMFEMDGVEQPMFEMEDDYGFYEDLDTDEESTAATTHLSMSCSDEDGAPLSIPICASRIDDEDPDSLHSSPPILSPFMVDTIAEDGLPWSMQDTQWDRLYASDRDGASFATFLRRVRGHDQTIIVAKTSDGRIVGGYATDVWSGRKQQQSASTQGKANHAFLFVVEPAPKNSVNQPATPVGNTFIPGLGDFGTSPTSALDFDFHQLSVSSSSKKRDEKNKPHVKIFKPSQKHTAMKQACQIGNKFISMTDINSDLSLVIENSFSRGVTRTQENRDEEFTIVSFEVYGFSED